MDEYVFFGVVTIDETVAAFNVEPFHSSRYLLSCVIEWRTTTINKN